MGMTAILFNGVEQYKQIVNTFLTEGSIWNLTKILKQFQGRRYLKISQFYTCI